MTILEIVLSVVCAVSVAGWLWLARRVIRIETNLIGNGKRGLCGDVESARTRLAKVEKEQAVHLAITDTGSSDDTNIADIRLTKRFADFLAVERRKQHRDKQARTNAG